MKSDFWSHVFSLAIAGCLAVTFLMGVLFPGETQSPAFLVV